MKLEFIFIILGIICIGIGVIDLVEDCTKKHNFCEVKND